MSNPLNSSFGSNTSSTVPPEMQQSISKAKEIINTLKSSNNPMAMLQQMTKNNPNLEQLMKMIQSGNPQDVFAQIFKQRGINPQDIINLLK